MIPDHAQSPDAEILNAQQARVSGRLAADLAVLAGCLLVFTVVAAALMPYTPDDSFISFRYAENLAAGQGLRFNAADAPLEAYSNFLWVVALAAAAADGLDLPATATLLGGILGSLSLVVLWWLLRRRGHTGIHLSIPLALLSLSGPFVLYAVSGMETALFGLLLLAMLLSADYLIAAPRIGRGVLLAVVGTLLMLVRPEGIIGLPVLLACLVALSWNDAADTRKAMLQAVVVAAVLFGVVALVYHIGRAAYFDSLLPTPFLSKGGLGETLIGAWQTNLRQFFVRQTHYYTPMAYYYLAIGLPALVGAILSFRHLRRSNIEVAALILAVAYAAVYINFVDWMPGMRYYAPLVGVVMIPLAALGPELQRTSGAAGDRRSDLSFLLLGLVLMLVSVFSLAAIRLDSQQLQASTQASQAALGHWLRETMAAGTVLAMSDVGAAPYYSGLHTFDMNPESLTDRTIAVEGWSAERFFEVNPDVVLMTAFSLTEPDFYGAHEELYALTQFQDTYQQIGVTRNDWYQDRSYWVFVRKDLPLTAQLLDTLPQGIRKQ